MRVASVGRVFASGADEPMRGGVAAEQFPAYLLQMVRRLRPHDPVVALKARDSRGQLTIYKPKAS